MAIEELTNGTYGERVPRQVETQGGRNETYRMLACCAGDGRRAPACRRGGYEECERVLSDEFSWRFFQVHWYGPELPETLKVGVHHSRVELFGCPDKDEELGWGFHRIPIGGPMVSEYVL
jgi:hypothetical protein